MLQFSEPLNRRLLELSILLALISDILVGYPLRDAVPKLGNYRPISGSQNAVHTQRLLIMTHQLTVHRREIDVILLIVG